MKWLLKDMYSLFRYYPLRTSFSLIALLLSVTTLTLFTTLNGNIEHHIENALHSNGERLGISLHESPIRIEDWAQWQTRFPKQWKALGYLSLPIAWQAPESSHSSHVIAMDPISWLSDQWKMESGRSLHILDSHNKVAMIGHDVANMIRAKDGMKRDSEWLLIGEQYYEIVGVLRKMEYDPLLNFDPNLTIFIPLSLAVEIIKDPRIQELLLYSTDTSTFSLHEKATRFFQNELPGTSIFYKDPKILQRMLFQQADLTIKALKLVTLITLVLGFFSTLNLFLILNDERKTEFGIRLALGATPSQLTCQILGETLFLCLGAGLFGMILGEVGAWIMSHYWKVDFLWQLLPIGLGLLLILIIGGLVGMISAYRIASEPVIHLL